MQVIYEHVYRNGNEYLVYITKRYYTHKHMKCLQVEAKIKLNDEYLVKFKRLATNRVGVNMLEKVIGRYMQQAREIIK